MSRRVVSSLLVESNLEHVRGVLEDRLDLLLGDAQCTYHLGPLSLSLGAVVEQPQVVGAPFELQRVLAGGLEDLAGARRDDEELRVPALDLNERGGSSVVAETKLLAWLGLDGRDAQDALAQH